MGVDSVGSFKPDPAVYRYALEELDCDAHEVTFVSAHAWDVTGAAHCGMRPAFVLRDESWASAYPRPEIEATSLPGIAAALRALSPAG